MDQRCEWADHGCSRYSCLSRACGTYHVPVLSPGADISSSLHDVNIIPNNEIIVLKVIGIIPCLVPGHETYHLYGSDADKFFAQDSMPFEAAPGARIVPENAAADEPHDEGKCIPLGLDGLSCLYNSCHAVVHIASDIDDSDSCPPDLIDSSDSEADGSSQHGDEDEEPVAVTNAAGDRG